MTCSSAEQSIDVGSECCDLALMVLDDAADGESDLSLASLNRGATLPFSVDGLALSRDALSGSEDRRLGSSEGREISGLWEEVDGLDGGEGGAPPWTA